MRLTSSGFAALIFLAAAGATPITLTFSGTAATAQVNGTTFMNQPFTITFSSDTTVVCQIGTSPCPATGDVGDFTTPNPTTNMFTIGTIVPASDDAELTGLTTSSGILGPSVFLNTNTSNVGIWFYNTTDWLTTASSAYTSSFGLKNNLSVGPGLQSFGNLDLGSTAMMSTVGTVSLGGLSNVSFVETVASATGPTGSSGPTGPTGTTGGPGPTPAAVPEPSTLMMLGIGIGGLVLGKIRRRRV